MVLGVLHRPVGGSMGGLKIRPIKWGVHRLVSRPPKYDRTTSQPTWGVYHPVGSADQIFGRNRGSQLPRGEGLQNFKEKHMPETHKYPRACLQHYHVHMHTCTPNHRSVAAPFATLCACAWVGGGKCVTCVKSSTKFTQRMMGFYWTTTVLLQCML